MRGTAHRSGNRPISALAFGGRGSARAVTALEDIAPGKRGRFTESTQ
jgi:hypothetical protein